MLLGAMVACRVLWHTGSQPSSVGPLWVQDLVQLNLPKTISALSLLCFVQKNNAEKKGDIPRTGRGRDDQDSGIQERE